MLITSSYMETDAEFAVSHNPKTEWVLGGQKAAVLAQTNWNKECWLCVGRYCDTDWDWYKRKKPKQLRVCSASCLIYLWTVLLGMFSIRQSSDGTGGISLSSTRLFSIPLYSKVQTCFVRQSILKTIKCPLFCTILLHVVKTCQSRGQFGSN